MKKRCIMILPKLETDLINNIRKKFDPLYNIVDPHITLVSVFKSKLNSKEIEKHVKNSIRDFTKFEILFNGIIAAEKFGNYLFLDIKKNEKLIEMHHKLYSNGWEKYKPEWLEDSKYFHPHLTLGKFETKEELSSALNYISGIDSENFCFKYIVNEIVVQIIDESNNSIIESRIELE